MNYIFKQINSKTIRSDKTDSLNKPFRWLPALLQQWIDENNVIITLSLSLVFFMSSIRILMTLTAGAIYHKFTLNQLLGFSSFIIIGPLVLIFTYGKIKLWKALFYTFLLSRIGLQLSSDPYWKLGFTLILLVSISGWVAWLIPEVKNRCDRKQVLMGILAVPVIDISLRAPTLGTETGYYNHLYVHIFVIFALILLYFSSSFLLYSNNSELVDEGKRGIIEGIIFTQVFTLFFTFFANPGELSVGFSLDSKLVLFLLISVNSLIFLLVSFIDWDVNLNKISKIGFSLFGAMIVLVAVLTRLWQEAWELPLPFIAIIALWVILMFTVFDQHLNPKKFAIGVIIGELMLIFYLMRRLQYDLEYFNIGYITLLGILSVVSIIFRRN